MNMGRIWQVFAYELKQNFTRKGFLFATFGIPLLAGLLMFTYDLVQRNQPPPTAEQALSILEQFDFRGIQKAGLVDRAGVFPTISAPLEGIIVPYASEADAREALRNRELDVFYIIAPDYLETGNVTLHLRGLSLNLLTSQPIEQLFYTTLAQGIDPMLLTALRQRLSVEEFNLQRTNTDSASNFDADFLTLYLFVIVYLLGIFMTNGYLLQSVIEEKENRLIEILVATIRPTELLTGKILALGVVGMTQVITWVVSMALLLNVAQSLPTLSGLAVLGSIRFPYEQLPIMFAYFVLGYLLFAALYGAVGALSSSMREGPGYAVVFTLPAILPFYFFPLFTQSPNGTLATVLSLVPITAPISMLMRLTIAQVPLVEVVISLSLLAVTIVGAMWLAGRLFRVQTLLAGQAPKLRDLPKLLR
jgi:ABC-2 type transport system permease protein